MLEVEKVCEKCGEINTLNGKTIMKDSATDCDGEKYEVIYFTCKRCGECVVLQIDNEETKALLERFKQLMYKTMQNNEKGIKPKKRDLKKKDIWNKDLKEKREQLKEIMSGKALYKNGEIFINHLTFLKEGDIL